MNFDEEVLYSTITEESLAVLGLRIDYWEAEEIADNTIRRLDEIAYASSRSAKSQAIYSRVLQKSSQ